MPRNGSVCEGTFHAFFGLHFFGPKDLGGSTLHLSVPQNIEGIKKVTVGGFRASYCTNLD